MLLKRQGRRTLTPTADCWMVGGAGLFLLLALSSIWCADAAPEADRIVNLPLWGPPPTPHYSGYLNATAGCDTVLNGPTCYLHYWFAMAADNHSNSPDVQSNDDDDDDEIPDSTFPIVLWMNGGPGSSSILGFLQELGPLLINATGGLMRNPYSWTQLAHVLVLESPIGVGYSYCASQAKDEICINNDRQSASAARAALVDFFTTKFPELANHDFYITGESYAGVYVPTLAYEILTKARDLVPLRGIAVGDPCTDNVAQEDSMNPIWYGYKYGLVDEAIYDVLWNQCGVQITSPLFQGRVSYRYNQTREFAQRTTTKNSTNDNRQSSFYIKMDDETASAWTQRRIRHRQQQQQQAWINMPYPADTSRVDSVHCRTAFRKFLFSTSHGLSQSWRDLYIDDYSLFSPVTNQEDIDMAAYMNRADVRKALHVTETPGTGSWPNLAGGFDYTKEYNACNEDAKPKAYSMIDFYRKLVPALNRVWIYNGDTDPCLSYEGTRTAVKRMGFTELDGGGYRPWFYHQAATTMAVLQERAPLFGPNLLLQDLGPQLGGEVLNYEHNLTFVTVHGSGHMVPQFRPQAALHMLSKFLTGDLLAPLMPSNGTIDTMSNTEFHQAMDDWTESAKQAPYVV